MGETKNAKAHGEGCFYLDNGKGNNCGTYFDDPSRNGAISHGFQIGNYNYPGDYIVLHEMKNGEIDGYETEYDIDDGTIENHVWSQGIHASPPEDVTNNPGAAYFQNY